MLHRDGNRHRLRLGVRRRLLQQDRLDADRSHLGADPGRVHRDEASRDEVNLGAANRDEVHPDAERRDEAGPDAERQDEELSLRHRQVPVVPCPDSRRRGCFPDGEYPDEEQRRGWEHLLRRPQALHQTRRKPSQRPMPFQQPMPELDARQPSEEREPRLLLVQQPARAPVQQRVLPQQQVLGLVRLASEFWASVSL